MPTCQLCGYKWGWKEAFFKMFTIKKVKKMFIL
ncbi:hypothetical protein J2Y73_003097 [Peribacillus frigoritolerans]|nr:hypothetical protein [Peribacillus frigoritolerans]